MYNKGKNFSIAALILGICSVLFCWFYLISVISAACGIVGIVCATNGQKFCAEAGQPAGLATAGLVLSIIGLVFSSLSFLTCTLCITCFGFST